MKLKNYLKTVKEVKIHYLIMDKEDRYVLSDFIVDYLDSDNERLNECLLERMQVEKSANVKSTEIDRVHKCLKIRCTM